MPVVGPVPDRRDGGELGLYEPAYESDACGVGYVVNINGIQSHRVIRDSQVMLERMEHRGACGCDNDTGDGAGVLTGIPHKLYTKIMHDLSDNGVLPDPGQYATGMMFLDRATAPQAEESFTKFAVKYGLQVLAWRTVPVDNTCIGSVARSTEPLIRQVFVTQPDGVSDIQQFQRQIYLLRKHASHHVPKVGVRFYICSLSTHTVVYKGLLNTAQLWQYFEDLKNPDYESHIALIHSRFSTNTFPSWERAHPQRYLAHNGEINTLRGNHNLMKAREGVMSSPVYGNQLQDLYPVVEDGMSDSGCVDNVLEFLCMAGGRELPEAVMTMVPEAWQNDKNMTEEDKAFCQ
ncbi:hypothetical protein ACOMHN_023574 [Nucella lapillus]